MQADAFGERGQVQIFLGVIDHRQAADAHGAQLICDAIRGEPAFGRLATGHRHRIIIEDFIGDTGAFGQSGADCQNAGVIIRAIAEVLEHVVAG